MIRSNYLLIFIVLMFISCTNKTERNSGNEVSTNQSTTETINANDRELAYQACENHILAETDKVITFPMVDINRLDDMTKSGDNLVIQSYYDSGASEEEMTRMNFECVLFDNDGRWEVIRLTSSEVNESYKEKFNVIKSDNFSNDRLSAYIRLENPVERDSLSSIANYIRETNPEYDNIFVFYSLPDQEVDEMAWATSHFTPELEVKILIPNYGEVDRDLSKTDVDYDRLIGKWKDESFTTSYRILYENDGTFYLQTNYDDKSGSSSTKEVTLTETSTGTEIREVGGNDFGEYYKINSNGLLEFRSSDGVFKTASPIE